MPNLIKLQKPKFIGEPEIINDFYKEIVSAEKIQNKFVENELIESKEGTGVTIDSCIFKNIVLCYYLTGDFDFMLKILCSSSEELEKIHRDIKSIEGISRTKTYFILKDIKK